MLSMSVFPSFNTESATVKVGYMRATGQQFYVYVHLATSNRHVHSNPVIMNHLGDGKNSL